jgi:hypothetical protein
VDLSTGNVSRETFEHCSPTFRLVEMCFNILYEEFRNSRRHILPEHAQSLWDYGHWHLGMIYCVDRDLAEALGDRYIPEAKWDPMPLSLKQIISHVRSFHIH